MAYQRPNDGLKAATRYLKKCDTITIRPLKAEGEKIRSAAELSGMSITKFIMTAVNEYMKNHPSATTAEVDDGPDLDEDFFGDDS